MAAHTSHPVSAPPAAPPRERTSHLVLRGWCTFVLVLAITGVGVVNAIGEIAGIVVGIAATLVSALLWVSRRPPLNPRRLPWFVLAYVLWAGISIAWSGWQAVSAVTWVLLAVTTMQGMFIAVMLTWREILVAVSAALRWVLGLSLAFELAVSVWVGGPLLPGWRIPAERLDPIFYWSRDNLFDGGRIQGIFGNANLLAAATLMAMIVFGTLFAARIGRRVPTAIWFVIALFLFARSESATSIVAAVAVAGVLATVLLMRTATRPGGRTRYYLAYFGTAAVVLIGAWFARDAVFTALGRSSNLTGRERIWGDVLARATEHPVIGNGFATPWLSWDPAFDGWIIDHDQTVMQAHNMWIDVFFQLGAIGVVLVAGVYLSLIWRAWFFAVDRPRFDLDAHRPYSPLTLVPTLTMAMLLVQGLAESEPLLLWGWLIVVVFATKIKQAPLVGVGDAEQTVRIERGEAVS